MYGMYVFIVSHITKTYERKTHSNIIWIKIDGFTLTFRWIEKCVHEHEHPNNQPKCHFSYYFVAHLFAFAFSFISLYFFFLFAVLIEREGEQDICNEEKKNKRTAYTFNLPLSWTFRSAFFPLHECIEFGIQNNDYTLICTCESAFAHTRTMGIVFSCFKEIKNKENVEETNIYSFPNIRNLYLRWILSHI